MAHRLRWVIGLWLGLFAGLGSAQPNIVLILSDDAGYNEIGYTGNNDFLTPRIDALAGEGIRFTNAYDTQPTCGPSRAGLLTGRYQQRFGFEDNVPNAMNAWEGLQPGQTTLAHRLRDLGYTTGLIGKWHLGSTAAYNRPGDMGFDEFFGTLGGSRHYWGGEVDEWRRIRRQDVEVEAQWPFEGDASRYDPVNGRYLTDAFGEEAVAFINNHADDAEPFFLFMAFTAPHQPDEAQADDLAAFPGLTGYTKVRAAMTLAMDRAVGDILTALADHGIEQETIVVYLNDNGGTSDRDNSPFRGYKGLTWEGGIRVPMCIRWPGMPQGALYDRPVISMDLVPTLVAAAGGQVGQTDGVDLAPYLTGQQQGDPHDAVYFRDRWEWAVRRGPWKLVRPDSTSRSIYLFNLDEDPGETTNVSFSNGPIVDAMRRDLTVWEASLDKLRWTSSGVLVLNNFDHFRSRMPSSFFSWSNSQAWYREASQDLVSLEQHDAYANAELEFPTRSSNYSANNALGRMSGERFMLRQFRFTNTSGQGGPFTGILTGEPVVMVPGLTGAPPSISLESQVTPFSFRIEHDVEFLGTLTIEGEGASPLTIAAPVTEYLPGQAVRKAGASQVAIEDIVACTGDITIAGGALIVRGPGGVLASAGRVAVEAPGLLRLEADASVLAPLLDNAGRVEGMGLLAITGDFSAQPGAVLGVGLGGTIAGSEHDQLLVSQTAGLGGRLALQLRSGFRPRLGDEFRIVQAAAVTGEFASIEFPPEQPHRRYALAYDATGVTLTAVCSADVDDDGFTDSRDFLHYLGLWAAGDPIADWGGNGTVDTIDFVLFLNEWSACRQ